MVKCVEAASMGQTNITYFKIGATALRKNQYYYRIYFVGANTVFGHIIPFVLLVIINVLIVRVLNAKPKPDDIVVSTNSRPTIRTEATTTTQIVRKSTIRVTTSVRRKAYVSNRELSTANTPKVRRSESQRRGNQPPPLSPSVFGLDSEHISYIDSPSVESRTVTEQEIQSEVLIREVKVTNNGHCVSNGGGLVKIEEVIETDRLHTGSGLSGPKRKRNRSRRADSVFSQTQASTVTVTVFVNEDEDDNYSANSSEHRTPSIGETADIIENLNIDRRPDQPSNVGTDVTQADTPRLVRHGGFRNGYRSRQPNAQEARLTRISLSIICLYLICHIWKLIPTFYEAFNGDVENPLPAWPEWLNVIKNLSHVLVVFNSAVNFLLYLIL